LTLHDRFRSCEIRIAIDFRRLDMSFTTTNQPSAQTDIKNAVLAHNWWAIALRGVFGILFGIIAFATPAVTMLSLVLVYAAYMLVDGLFAIVAAARAARHHERWGLLILEGVVDLLAGAFAVAWPGLTVLAFVILVAAWAIVSGGLMVAAAAQLKLDHGRWWLVFGGIASVIYGILLIMAPLIGAVVLTWWIGAYALVFGASLLVLGFRLRTHRNDDAIVGGMLHA
jgi:uncharacterized membrane protein HdeD (DUF308 family)